MKKIIKYLMEIYDRTTLLFIVDMFAMNLYAISQNNNDWEIIIAICSIGYFMLGIVLAAIYYWLSKEESD